MVAKYRDFIYINNSVDSHKKKLRFLKNLEKIAVKYVNIIKVFYKFLNKI